MDAIEHKQYKSAELYLGIVIYIYENIEIFWLYNNQEKFDSSKWRTENVWLAYNVLKINEQLFILNNRFIQVTMETHNFKKSLTFIVNNHFIYKNSMKLIDCWDPCKYATKNPNKIIL